MSTFRFLSFGFGCAMACSASGDPPERFGSKPGFIIGGEAEERSGSSAVVFLGSCSGVLVNAHTLVTVEHCLDVKVALGEAPPERVELRLTAGAQGEICLTPAADGTGCGKRSLRIARQEASDVILLQSEEAFDGVPEVFPQIGTEVSGGVRAHGFGVSSFELSADGSSRAVGLRLSAEMVVRQTDPEHLYGGAVGQVRVCGGDSGGPLLSEEGSAGVLYGVLSASEYDEADPLCTRPGGLSRWSRIDPEFVAGFAGPCSRSALGLDCSDGGFERAPTYSPPRAPAPDTAALLARLRNAGAQIYRRDEVTSDIVERDQLVGLSTEEGDYAVRLPAPVVPEELLHAEQGEGEQGQRVPLSPRALALSGNGDQRDEFFVVQAGALNATSTTGVPSCTATLIGRRVVRTAKHCIENTSRPWFTQRYNGGVTTWTFDGGATWVTFNPRRADFHWYGGNFFNFNCGDWLLRGGTPTSETSCSAQDWAILIMAENVWDPVNVIPSYMGFNVATGVTAVANSGYPGCGDISSPNISGCTNGIMYGMSSCTIGSNSTSFFYTNCDVSPGHSGSPTFYTSGGRFLVGNHSNGPTNTGCSNGTCQARDCGTDSWLKSFQDQARADYNTVTL